MPLVRLALILVLRDHGPTWHSDVAAIVQRVSVTYQTKFPIPYPVSTGVY